MCFSSLNDSGSELLLEDDHVVAIFNIFLFLRYLTELYGRDVARLKLSQIMGCMVELRHLCERSKSEEETQRVVPRDQSKECSLDPTNPTQACEKNHSDPYRKQSCDTRAMSVYMGDNKAHSKGQSSYVEEKSSHMESQPALASDWSRDHQCYERDQSFYNRDHLKAIPVRNYPTSNPGPSRR